LILQYGNKDLRRIFGISGIHCGIDSPAKLRFLFPHREFVASSSVFFQFSRPRLQKDKTKQGDYDNKKSDDSEKDRRGWS